jgi:hypothetical protein
MSERIAAMTPIERAAFELVLAIGVMSCDGRNDAPWKALRDIHREAINQACAELDIALRDKFGSFTVDDFDAAWGIDE